MKIIREEKTAGNNNESQVKRGVYFNEQTNEYEWLTFTRSGTCKKLETALNKAGF